MSTAELKQKLDLLVSLVDRYIAEVNAKDAQIDEFNDERVEVENLLVDCRTVIESLGVLPSSVIITDLNRMINRLADSNSLTAGV